MYFRVVVNKTEIDLFQDMSIQFKLTNPLFSASNWNEGYSYGFDIPKSAKNYRLFYNREDIEYPVTIFYKGLPFVSGTLVSKINDSKISVNVKEQGTDLRQQLEKTHFDEVYIGEVVICDEADSPTVKIDKWYDHMVETTLTAAVDEGSHKFPRILVDGYNSSDSDDIINNIFYNNRSVNPYILGDYMKNQPIPTSYVSNPESPGDWLHTVSPCIRIQWLLEEVLKAFNVTNVNGSLLDVPEFTQLVNFSGYVHDQVEIDGSDSYNVHGLKFEFNDHLPDNNILSLFDMLSEMFGAFYVVSGNDLNIYLRDDIVRMKPVDMSRYASEEFSRDSINTVKYVMKYDIEDSNRNYGVERVETYPFLNKIFSYRDQSYFGFGKEEEIIVSNIPMLSNYWLGPGLLPDYASYVSNQFYDYYGWHEYHSWLSFRIPVRSDVFPEESIDRPEVFILGLVRGIYTTRNLLHDGAPNYNIIGEESVPHMYVCNFNTQPIADDSLAPFAAHIVTFGDSSLYIGGDDNLSDKYFRRFYEFLANSREIAKNLNLPVHELLELKKWKTPKHTINLKNLSFEGIVKEASFTLHNTNGVSPVNITYVVENSITGRDYNDDWNDDYLN